MEGFEFVVPADETRMPGMKTLEANVEGKNTACYIPNVEYIKCGDMALYLQLFLPEGLFPGMPSSKRFPLIVYVQGAAWGEQDVFYNLPQIGELAKRGYVVASVKHRASSVAGFPAFLQDVKSAIRFLRANADMYFINPEEVAIWGDSSGGHASLMVGVTGDMEEFKTEDNHDLSDSVKAVVDFFGPTDLTQINNAPRNPEFVNAAENIPEDILFGGSVAEHPEIAQVGNPIQYVSEEKNLPPFLIVHGDRDAMVPFNQSVLMVEKLQKCKKEVEFYKVCGADHGIFFWSNELLDLVEEFIGRHLKNKE